MTKAAATPKIPPRTDQLLTPALVFEADALEHNLATMAKARPGSQLRPHVKAHKCTELAKRQAEHGHHTFTCATARELIGMAAAHLGEDLLLANEVLDTTRLRALAGAQKAASITIAVDSDETVDAAAKAGLKQVLVDVNVGLARCGVAPEKAGKLADYARSKSLTVRGVMGYEGHLMIAADRAEQYRKVAGAMDLLLKAHQQVGGDVISAGGTGTYDLHDRVTEVQAGSYALMDSHYAQLGLPFQQACFVIGTVISVGFGYAVADVGLKALGMDHGNPVMAGASVWFCGDEHITFAPTDGVLPKPGDRVRVTPAHIDPTIAMHDAAFVIRGDDVLDRWSIDLRGW